MKNQKLFAALLCAASSLACAVEDEPLEITIVTDTRIEQPLAQSIAHATVITRGEIEASQVADVPALLKSLAGVEFYQSGGVGKQSSLFLRGSNPTHVLVLVDGVRIGSATTGATAIDQLMLDQVERIEVVRGNVSSLYGSEAIGGVVQIFTRRGKGEPTFNMSVGGESHNTQRMSAGFGGEVADTAFNVQVSKLRTDGISAVDPAMVATVNPDNDGYDNTSLSGMVQHRLGADHNLSISAFQSRGDIQYDDTWGAPTDLDVMRSDIGKVALAVDSRLGDAWQSRLQFAQSVDDSRRYKNEAKTSAFRTLSRQAAWQNTLAAGSTGSLLLGAEKLALQADGTTAYSESTRVVDSVFAGYTGEYGAHQVQANLRQDRYSDFGTANTWLLGYGLGLTEAWRITASMATAFKAPTLNDMFYPFEDYGFGFTYVGNPDLKPEWSRGNEVGLHYGSNGQNWNLVYFSNRIRDLIVSNGLAAMTMINLDEARIDGMEFSYDGKYGDTSLRAALTRQNPHDVNTGLALVRRAKTFASLSAAQPFGNWQVGGEWQYSGEREDYDINTFSRTTLPSYSLVNLTASYAVDRQLTLSLRADNLLDREYMLAHGFNTMGRTLFAGLNYRQ